MNANANGWHGAPIAAADEAKASSLCEESNKEWRPMPPVPFGLLPKTPSAALRRLARCATCRLWVAGPWQVEIGLLIDDFTKRQLRTELMLAR